MRTDLPAPARLLGPAGLIPFAALAIGIWAGVPGAGPALAAYGATILAFLGAVHWGLALVAPAAERGADWGRLGLGVVPSLIAWVALLLPPQAGLLLLAVIFALLPLADRAAQGASMAPAWWWRLRLPLSLLMACLHGVSAGMVG